MRVFRPHAARIRLKRTARPGWLLLPLLAAAGCLSPPETTPESEPPRRTAIRPASPPIAPLSPTQYQVRSGDTLYAIAWRFGLDYRDLARFNDIHPPYLIRPGQTLRLHLPPTPAATSPPAPPPTRAPTRGPAPAARGEPSPPLSAPPPSPSRTLSPPLRGTLPPGPPPRSTTGVPAPPPGNAAPPPVPLRPPRPGQWTWPTRGRPVHTRSPVARSGIDIQGQAGQAVHAAAPGEVVYVGDGVLSYGNLVIIKHSAALLSAYGYNRKVLVREGQRVTGGRHIAAMGTAPDGRHLLHFEIRRAGKSVDPLRYLRSPP